jgi:hypothetical protein
MRALPPTIEGDVPQVTGIACPDCAGVLEVQAEGHDGNLLFICRIGHTYDVTELLAAKEEGLDGRLWSVITAFEELIALLTDLTTRTDGRRVYWVLFDDRVARARDAVVALREIVRMNRPIDLAPAEPGPLIADAQTGPTGEP